MMFLSINELRTVNKMSIMQSIKLNDGEDPDLF